MVNNPLCKNINLGDINKTSRDDYIYAKKLLNNFRINTGMYNYLYNISKNNNKYNPFAYWNNIMNEPILIILIIFLTISILLFFTCF